MTRVTSPFCSGSLVLDGLASLGGTVSSVDTVACGRAHPIQRVGSCSVLAAVAHGDDDPQYYGSSGVVFGVAWTRVDAGPAACSALFQSLSARSATARRRRTTAAISPSTTAVDRSRPPHAIVHGHVCTISCRPASARRGAITVSRLLIRSPADDRAGVDAVQRDHPPSTPGIAPRPALDPQRHVDLGERRPDEQPLNRRSRR